MAHYYSTRFLLAVEDGGSGSDIAAEGDEENKYWFPHLEYEVYYPIIWTLLGLLVVILQIFCCVGWIAFCRLYCKKRRERGIGRENRQRATANNGAMMNTYTRPEPPPGNPTATNGPETVLIQPVRQEVDRTENSLRQTEEDIDEPVVLAKREREEQQDMGPEEQNSPGPDESITTRPTTLQQHPCTVDTIPTRGSMEPLQNEGATLPAILDQLAHAASDETDVHGDSTRQQTEYEGTSPQKKVSSKKPKTKPAPLSTAGTRNPQSGKSYPSTTLPPPAAGKNAVSPKSATFPGPGKTSQTSLNQKSDVVPREKKTKPLVTNQRFSDYSETNSLVKDQSAKHSHSADELRFPYSVETSDSRTLEKQISNDGQETVPGIHSSCVITTV